MKKFGILLVTLLMIALAGCTLTPPGVSTNNDSPVIILNDTFLFTDDEPHDDMSGDMSDDMSTDDDMMDNEVVLTTITVVEGETASMSFLDASDPDGDSIDFSFGKPFNKKGEWETEDGDAGTYIVEVMASDGVLTTTEKVRVVVTPSNKGPVIDCPASLTINEGNEGTLPCKVYDAEGDDFTYEVSGYLDSLDYKTGYGDAGVYQVTITATDGNKETVHELSLRVANVNRAPVVQQLAPIKATEGDEIQLELLASDPDGDELEITYPILFDDNGAWETQKGDAGNYELEAEVSDGEDSVVVPVRIIVEKVNFPPTMKMIGTVEVDEGETIELDINAEDEEGDDLKITYEGFMNADTYTTTYDDAGEYTVTVTVSDGKHTITQDIAIIVNNVNRPPVFIVN